MDHRQSERRPLLDSHDGQVAQKEDTIHKPRWQIWPMFTTIAPKYRFVPLLGCLLIFTNEAEYFFKQVATMRAIESMYCIEFYSTRDPDLANLGKHIPEKLCKDHLIQKQLAKTAGLIMFFRMLSAVIGAIPLGQLADKGGRKIVIVMHKLNVILSNGAWLTICKLSSQALYLQVADYSRPSVPTTANLGVVLHGSTRYNRWQLRPWARAR